MKTKLHLFLACFLFVSVSGQIAKNLNNFNSAYFSSQKNTLPVNLYQTDEKTLKLDSILVEWANNINDTWLINSKKVFYYDLDGKEYEEIDYNWFSGSNIWFPMSKQSIDYDTNGNPWNYKNYDWNDTDTLWDLSSSEEYLYDQTGLLYGNIYSGYNQFDTWDTITKSFIERDSSGYLSGVKYYQKDPDSGNWDTIYIYNYLFDTLNKNVLITINTKIDSTDQWFGSYEFQFFYDDNGNDTLQINKLFSAIDTTIFSLTKRSTKYDHFGNLILTTDYKWNKEDSLWALDSKSDYSFDTTVFAIDLAVPDYFNNFTFANQLIQEMDFNYEMDDWQNDQRSIMYYSSLIPINEVKEIINIKSFKIYPNPASDVITIDLNRNSGNIEVFDLQGRKVLSQELLDETQLSVQHLNNGIYFYRINTSNGISTGKLIIKK